MTITSIIWLIKIRDFINGNKNDAPATIRTRSINVSFAGRCDIHEYETVHALTFRDQELLKICDQDTHIRF